MPRRLLATAAVLVLLAACGDDDDAVTSTTSTTEASTSSSSEATSSTNSTSTTVAGKRIEVTVSGGEVQGGVRRESVDRGERVTIVVTADVSDEVHVHGYDLLANVAPGRPAQIGFVAELAGVWEVELESAHLPLLELEVR